MFYSHALTIPANTAKGSPTQYDLRVTMGLLHRVEVEFPAGCAGLAHVVLKRWGSQLYPTNPDGNLASDNFVIAFDDYYEMMRRPYILRLVGWNEDDTYAHTVTIRVGILPPQALARAEESLGILKRIARLIGLK